LRHRYLLGADPSQAVPKITSDFHSIPDIGWYASAYLLANCALQPLSGKLYTHLSSKYTFLSFLGVFELGSLLCGVSNSSSMLIVGRAVAGLGGSGLTNGALTIITASVPLRRRPVLIGSLVSVAQIGTVLGPLIGGALTQYTTWRWCKSSFFSLTSHSLNICSGFYINLPAGAAAAALVLAIRIPDRVVKDDKKSSLKRTIGKLDLFGAALFASTIVMFLLALQWGGQTYPWNSATVIGLFVGSVGNLSVFLAWERRRGAAAMIPLAMLAKRVVYSSCLVQFFQMANLMVTTYYLAIWFQVVKEATPTISGVYLLPGILSQMMFAIISGILGESLLSPSIKKAVGHYYD
jgi:MFS family permease